MRSHLNCWRKFTINQSEKIARINRSKKKCRDVAQNSLIKGFGQRIINFHIGCLIQQIALLLNTHRDVAMLRLYKERGFTHLPYLPEICCNRRYMCQLRSFLFFHDSIQIAI